MKRELETKVVTVPMGRVMGTEEIQRLEDEHSAVFITAALRVEEGLADVELFPVFTTRFHIDVWDMTGRLVVRTEEGEEWLYSDDFGDPDLFDRLVEKVVYGDNDGAINISGKYYPQSQESVDLFEELMESRKED